MLSDWITQLICQPWAIAHRVSMRKGFHHLWKSGFSNFYKLEIDRQHAEN
jgi:hypothetical protein